MHSQTSASNISKAKDIPNVSTYSLHYALADDLNTKVIRPGRNVLIKTTS